ncbi:MAG TPA: hypothetical protein VM364_02690 [Vicinamibacterales bacterium]|nr:hypothetical protein [Vicinamibacterales bacterium]
MRTDELMDMTNGVPKVITPATHAVLDYITAGTFIAMGFALLGRNRRAAGLAFANGAAVLGLSLMTDYPGGVFKTVSFRTHGAVDMLQAGMSAMGPALLGFASEPEAQMFHAQAAVEAAVVAATDWNNSEAQRLAA